MSDPRNRTDVPTTGPKPGAVAFVGSGPGDPDLLTIGALRTLQDADVVLYDKLVSDEILALVGAHTKLVDVGKEAFNARISQAEICDRMIAYARDGEHVVRLKSGDPAVFGRLDEELSACEAADIDYSIVPGITAASAAAASIGQSLTQRGRNASVRFLTGHDMKGFANHDWAALVEPGAVSAVYMGKKSARFIQGRLIMSGGDRAMPITIVENASRPDERVLETTLDRLPTDLADAGFDGPALTFLGLSPRKSRAALKDLSKELA